MRRTKEEARQTRQDIISSALSMFARRGYAATRLDDVAVDAGVTRGAVYFHFRDKVELFRATFETPSMRVGEAMQTALSGAAPVPERLERWFMSVVELAANDDEVRATLEIQWLRSEAVDELEADMTAKRESTADLIRMLARMIRNGIRDGDLAAAGSPTAIATGLVALLTGLLQGWILDESIPLVRRGRVIIRTYLNGFVSAQT